MSFSLDSFIEYCDSPFGRFCIYAEFMVILVFSMLSITTFISDSIELDEVEMEAIGESLEVSSDILNIMCNILFIGVLCIGILFLLSFVL